MGRLAEGTAELLAEVRTGVTRGPSQVGNGQRLGIVRVGEVFGAQQMPPGRDGGHEPMLGIATDNFSFADAVSSASSRLRPPVRFSSRDS